MTLQTEKTNWLDAPISSHFPKLTRETLLVVLILLAAVFTRFYLLGDRVMSHDEVNHVVPSFDLYEGRGYVHDPVTHGPLQFHLVALSYFLLGDSDFSSRVPAALFSIATVLFVWWGFRRYLGRWGALISSFLFLISPYMLFYGRYTRNEAFVALFGVIMLYAVLRYLETGKTSYLYLFTAVTALHFTSKETAFIYAAQTLIFLGVLFLDRVTRRDWKRPEYYRPFILGLIISFALVAMALAVYAGTSAGIPAAAEGAAPAATPISPYALILGGAGLLGVILSLAMLVRGFSWESIRRERSFDLLVLLGTLVLPQLSPFAVKLAGWNPLDYTSQGALHTAVFLIPIVLITILIGVWWNRKVWLGNFALFYGIFIVFYTTFFTNGQGFFTGLVGSLGYWLSQQGVNRGEQPVYYYALLQIPVYEYLPALGTLLAAVLGIRQLKRDKHLWHPGDAELTSDEAAPLPAEAVEPSAAEETPISPERQEPPVLALLLFWSVSSLIAYSYAGEKMPWLTVHITLGMLLCTGWSLGYLVESTRWQEIRAKKGWLALVLLPVFLISLISLLGNLFGARVPFAGKTTEQLQATYSFLFSLLTLLGSGAGLAWIFRQWADAGQVRRTMTFAFFALLAVVTARTAFRASYINYNNAKEYLVYAHAARGPKDVLAQVEDISRRLTGGLDIQVAYDNDTRYPYWWYFRHYPNRIDYDVNPTNDLRNAPIILVGADNYSKIEPVVGNSYQRFDYMRLWWPNQDYYLFKWANIQAEYDAELAANGAESAQLTLGKYLSLSLKHIGDFITNSSLRDAIWQIWYNADYTCYAEVTGKSGLTMTDWSPSNTMRMYIRKDVLAKIWNYGASGSADGVTFTDPYEGKSVKLEAAQVVGAPGSAEGQFQSPRSVAAAPDGTLYVADSKNNRIQHLAADGTVLESWGTFGDALKGEVPGGQFSEPWGVAVGPDGSVYVADTWNSRIQKFTADGRFLKMWGVFGTAETPGGLWGPRAIAVDGTGRVFVTDT
ncbi:MAG: flippase activity-associated protein Agl23, partial [Anaerolineaceae bacterium]